MALGPSGERRRDMIYQLTLIEDLPKLCELQSKPRCGRRRETEYGARVQEGGGVDQRRLLCMLLLVAGLAEGSGEPFKTLVETVTRSSTGGLDVLYGNDILESIV